MPPLRFAVVGAGFWSRYQLAAWKELPDAECVAIYNRTLPKAEALAGEFGVPGVYDDLDAMLAREQLDFVDIISAPEAHEAHVRAVASRGLPVVCQKPIAPALAVAERMVEVCRNAGVPFIIHENFRYQTPIRALKAVLESGAIGKPYRARLVFCSEYPVFDNQPFLKNEERFILADLGVHIVDCARFLLGDVRRLFCIAARTSPEIRGENVATVLLDIEGIACSIELAYASHRREEVFPQMLGRVEGDLGSVDLAPDYWLHVVTASGQHSERHAPPEYPWANPDYALVHSSIVPCNASVIQSLRSGVPAETAAADNIKTVRAIDACYESASVGRSIDLTQLDLA